MLSKREVLLQRMESLRIRRLESEVRRLRTKCHLLEQNQKSPRDPLTGALTREHFDGVLARIVKNHHRRASEKNEDLAFVMVDLDDFKLVNDTHGHAAGDEVLRSFSEIAHGHLRENDLVCRRGGDEFVALLRGANSSMVTYIMTKLRRKFEGATFTFHRGVKKLSRIHPSFSYGVAMYEGGRDSLVMMFSRADVALYEEKRARKSMR